MTFLVYAMLLVDVVIGTFFDLVGKTLNSQFGIVLFIAMSVVAFCAAQYVLRRLMVMLNKDVAGPSFFYKMYRAIPLIQYVIAAIFVIVIFQMILFANYNISLLIILNTLTGMVGVMFLGFRCYKFFSWYKSNKRNIMTLAFAIGSALIIFSIVATIVVNDWVFLDKPNAINSEYKFNIDVIQVYTPTQNILNLYAYVIPVVLHLPVEMIGVAFFLHYFIEKIGKIKYWIIVTLPPTLLLFGVFGPQLLIPVQGFVLGNTHFAFFRIVEIISWIVADFVMGYAYLLVARNIRKISPNSMVVNYVMIAAFASILISPTLNDWITNTSYPPFGTIIRGFLPFATFLFSTGIYSAALSVSQDAKLRQSIRKFAKESKLLDTLGTAQMEGEIQQKVVRLAREQADAMVKETGAESSMTDDDIKQYLIQVISEVRKKDTR